METIRKALSNNLKRLRGEMRLTQDQVSEQTGIPKRSYQKYESLGVIPKDKTGHKQKLAKFFGISEADLFRTEAPTTQKQASSNNLRLELIKLALTDDEGHIKSLLMGTAALKDRIKELEAERDHFKAMAKRLEDELHNRGLEQLREMAEEQRAKIEKKKRETG